MKKNSTISRDRPIRVLLFSEYEIVRESLKLLIESSRDLVVEGVYSTSEEAGELNPLTDPEVGVVYCSERDPIDFIKDLLRRSPNLRIVVIADGLDLETQAELVRLGAFGVVHKEQRPDLLIDAIRRTHNGETWLDHALLTKVLERGKARRKKPRKGFAVEGGESLTPRELEIISIIGEGLKNKDIGERLLISEATVRHHLSSIYGKVGVEDRLNLVIFAYERGLIRMADDSGEAPR
jgi:DNA-binding NarL/FixJ family response regulator